MDGSIHGSRYQRRRVRMLATAAICNICHESMCPHCKGSAAHCGGGLNTVDHVVSRANGGAVSAENEAAAHVCCNLKKGKGDKPVMILRTSRQW